MGFTKHVVYNAPILTITLLICSNSSVVGATKGNLNGPVICPIKFTAALIGIGLVVTK